MSTLTQLHRHTTRARDALLGLVRLIDCLDDGTSTERDVTCAREASFSALVTLVAALKRVEDVPGDIAATVVVLLDSLERDMPKLSCGCLGVERLRRVQQVVALLAVSLAWSEKEVRAAC